MAEKPIKSEKRWLMVPLAAFSRALVFLADAFRKFQRISFYYEFELFPWVRGFAFFSYEHGFRRHARQDETDRRSTGAPDVIVITKIPVAGGMAGGSSAWRDCDARCGVG